MTYPPTYESAARLTLQRLHDALDRCPYANPMRDNVSDHEAAIDGYHLYDLVGAVLRSLQQGLRQIDHERRNRETEAALRHRTHDIDTRTNP